MPLLHLSQSQKLMFNLLGITAYWTIQFLLERSPCILQNSERIGSFEGIEAVQGNYVADDANFQEALEMLFTGAVSHPHEVSYVVGIINPVFYIFYELMLQMFGSDFQFPLVT